jgi:ADP-ribosylglycohydrolase
MSQTVDDQRLRFRGCLLGGAVGDALGAPVEFMSLAQIRKSFGEAGIRDFAEAYGRQGAITDDTQMTLFTAEGLLRADNQRIVHGTSDPVSSVHKAYLRWLFTQGQTSDHTDFQLLRDGVLIGLEELHDRRAPGGTCIGALCGDRMGTVDKPLNHSKGCGGVMRIAPVGLAGEDPFELGCQVAAITHGHPSGYLAAGFQAMILSAIVSGVTLQQALSAGLSVLKKHPEHEETIQAVERAIEAAEALPATPESVESLGEGWVAEEALAIALFCTLKARDFESGVILAANHTGDTDSTGAITGNLLGLIYGEDQIPDRWLNRLELRDEIAQIADDLWAHFSLPDFQPSEEDLIRYPPQ